MTKGVKLMSTTTRVVLFLGGEILKLCLVSCNILIKKTVQFSKVFFFKVIQCILFV